MVEAYKNAISKKGGCLYLLLILLHLKVVELEDGDLLRFRDTEMDIIYKNLSKV